MDLIKSAHLPIYLDATLWSRTMNAKIDLVDKNAVLDSTTGTRPIVKVVTTKTHDSNANIQKKSLLEYDLKYKMKSQE